VGGGFEYHVDEHHMNLISILSLNDRQSTSNSSPDQRSLRVLIKIIVENVINY
jgi:hypothetical protein